MNMFVQSFRRLAPLALVALLASCGGGGGDAGDSTEFAVVPATVSFKAGDGDTSCQYTKGTQLTFAIVGGQPPYRIVNSVPQYLQLDRTEATGKDPQFKVTTLTGCGDPLTILILDYHSQSASVEITIEKGDDAT
ncbi:hypothetical protein [Hydrogenophaga sp. PAMC20947]|uniref:hypothetical protein n=1 Tax=Hydrogenophaga sp. PAMC20947 TaxID=2565558 RepID=UPI00109D9818|nr:hypothetical protein [Hydrogenophaga sp. PAMC20947]QCB46739.1 hypothetical protein E5678_12310 [Hydrogenophaga sp. PAMC20947]